MRRVFALLYGLLCYGLFLATFLYLIGFVGNIGVPKTIDSPGQLSGLPALIINSLLIALFAVQHSVMARPWFKQILTTVIPEHLERSTYVLATGVVLILLFVGWQGMPQAIWSAEQPLLVGLLWGLFALGWLIALLSSFLIDHFDLFGLRQVYLHFRGRPYTPPVFREVLFYRWVRHPLMTGLLLAFWATPQMSVGHLLFAVLMTVYIVIGVHLEEQDLRAQHGEDYRAYQDRVARLCPFARPRRESG